VGCHHWRAGNHHGARALLRKGIGHLGPFAPACRGVDVAALVGDATALLETLERGDAPFDPRLAPLVRLVAS